MIEPIFRAENQAALPAVADIAPDHAVRARDRALLWRATTLALEGAFRFGEDMPVGAVAASRDYIIGRYFASDRRLGFREQHAEYMAVLDALISADGVEPDTVVVTIEPCNNCQDYLASVPSIKRVGFSIARQEVADKGLVKPRGENIFARAARLGLPYEVVQIEDEQLHRVGGIILDCVTRDPIAETVRVDRAQLHASIMRVNAEYELPANIN